MQALVASELRKFHKKHHSETLSDLRNVGSIRSVGCLPLSTIKMNGGNVDELIMEAKQKGFIVRLFPEGETHYGSGALYIADPLGLTKLLTENKDTLTAYGWSSEPLEFIGQLATQLAPRKTKLFDVVADAFADYK